MPTGRIKAWLTARKFGFAQVDGGGEDFIHQRDIPISMDSLMPGTRVQFELSEFSGRKCAVNVDVMPAPSA